MKFKGFSPSIALLWRVTAGMVILLLVITLMLVVKARTRSSAGFTGTISSQNTFVYLRSQPTDSSQTIAILDPGTAVYVDNSSTRDDMIWYHVKTASGNGWIPEANLDITNP